MMTLILSFSGELFPLVAADLGDILQSRCGDDDGDEDDGECDDHGEMRRGGYEIRIWYTCHARDCAMVDVMRMLIMTVCMMNRL